MKTVIICPVYGREKLSEKWLKWYANNEKYIKIDIMFFLGGDFTEIQNTVDRLQFNFAVESSFIKQVFIFGLPNNPLGAKFNALVQTAKAFDPDQVLILGQDDFISQGYLATLESLEFDMAGPLSCNFYNQGTGEAVKITGKPDQVKYNQLPIQGAGRVLRRPFLEAINWEIFQPDLNRGLDLTLDQKYLRYAGAMNQAQHINELPGLHCQPDTANFWMVDVKTGEGLSPWSNFAHLPKTEIDKALRMLL